MIKAPVGGPDETSGKIRIVLCVIDLVSFDSDLLAAYLDRDKDRTTY